MNNVNHHTGSKPIYLSTLIDYRDKLHLNYSDADIARKIVKRQFPGLDNVKTVKTYLSKLNDKKKDTRLLKKILDIVQSDYAKELMDAEASQFSFEMKSNYIYYIYYYYSFTEKAIKPGIFEIKVNDGKWENGSLYYLAFDLEKRQFINRSKYTLKLTPSPSNKFLYYSGTSDMDDRISFFIINLKRTTSEKRFCLFGTYNGLVAYNDDVALSAGKFILVKEDNVARKINYIAENRSVEAWIENKLLFANRIILIEDEGKGYKDRFELDNSIKEFNQLKSSTSIAGYYIGYYLRQDIDSDEGGLVRVLLELHSSARVTIHYRDDNFDPSENFPNHHKYDGFFYFPYKKDNAIIKGEFEIKEVFGFTSRILTFLKTMKGNELHGIITGKKRQGDGKFFSSPIIFKKIGLIKPDNLKEMFEATDPLRIPKSKLPERFSWGTKTLSLNQLKNKLSELSESYFETAQNSID